MKEFISFRDGNKLILRIRSDGSIELGDDVVIDQASDVFYQTLSRMMVNGIPLFAYEFTKDLIKAGDRMAGRIELLEHHKLADEHDIVARKLWLKTKDSYDR